MAASTKSPRRRVQRSEIRLSQLQSQPSCRSDQRHEAAPARAIPAGISPRSRSARSPSRADLLRRVAPATGESIPRMNVAGGSVEGSHPDRGRHNQKDVYRMRRTCIHHSLGLTLPAQLSPREIWRGGTPRDARRRAFWER